MSSEEHGAPAGADHDEHHEEFDPSPVQKLGADEPETPLWLSAVGVALFGLAGLYLALGGGEEEEVVSAPPPVVATPPAPPPAEAAVRGAAPARGGLPAGVRPPQTPEERKALADRLRALRGRQQLQRDQPQPAPRANDGAKR